MCKMKQGRETRMETETQKMATRERVILMMLGNVVPEVMTGWASRLRQTWRQKVNAASGFNCIAAGTPVYSVLTYIIEV